MITLYRPSGYNSPRASSFAGRSVDDKSLDVENGGSFKEIVNIVDYLLTIRLQSKLRMVMSFMKSTPVKSINITRQITNGLCKADNLWLLAKIKILGG